MSEYYSSSLADQNTTSNTDNDTVQSEDEDSDCLESEKQQITDEESDFDEDPKILDVYSIRDTGMRLTGALKYRDLSKSSNQCIILPILSSILAYISKQCFHHSLNVVLR